MQRTTYLNVILTVNAGLLSVLAWTQLASRPLLAQPADAQISRASAGVPGIPNAAAQRDQMIRHLDRVNHSIEALAKLIEAGKARVEVTNLSEIQIELPEENE